MKITRNQLRKVIRTSIKELDEKELVQTFDSPHPTGGCICVYLDTTTGNYSSETNHNDCECTMAASNDPNNTNACCAAEGLVHVGPIVKKAHQGKSMNEQNVISDFSDIPSEVPRDSDQKKLTCKDLCHKKYLQCVGAGIPGWNSSPSLYCMVKLNQCISGCRKIKSVGENKINEQAPTWVSDFARRTEQPHNQPGITNCTFINNRVTHWNNKLSNTTPQQKEILINKLDHIRTTPHYNCCLSATCQPGTTWWNSHGLSGII